LEIVNISPAINIEWISNTMPEKRRKALGIAVEISISDERMLFFIVWRRRELHPEVNE